MGWNLALPAYEHARRTPSRPALWVGGTEYTYQELATLAERIAGWLIRQSSRELFRVGVLASLTYEAYAGILGACWAGAAYVPLSTDWPEERLTAVLKTLQLNALIVDDQGLRLLSNQTLGLCPPCILAPGIRTSLSLGTSDQPISVAGFDALPPPDARDIPRTLGDNHLAYIIFTSGTTGSPKGVMISTSNVFHFLSAMKERFPFGQGERISQMFELTFDFSVLAVFLAWDLGASVEVVPRGQRMGPSRFIQERQLTVWFSVPSTVALMSNMRMLKPGVFPSLRYSAFCGEPLPVSSVQAWHVAAPNSTIDNLYGPTEATVACLAQRCGEPPNVTQERGTIAIGKPFVGMKAAIFDPLKRRVNHGDKGELALSGAQVSKGYFQDLPQTAARFPVIDGKIWYLTGDLAYCDEAGALHYLGRTDNQVKVLGHRVELEDVEAHLRGVCGTETAAALAWPMMDGSAQGIVAFVGGSKLSAAEVREGMKRCVPKYMVPTQVLFLETIPLTTSGKVDRKELAYLLAEPVP